jgi:hypothetical protein
MATLAIIELLVEGVEDEAMDPVTDTEVRLRLVMSAGTDMGIDMGINIMDLLLLLLLLDMGTKALPHLPHLDHLVMALALTHLDHPDHPDHQVIDFPLLHLDTDMNISIAALLHLDHLDRMVMDIHLNIPLLHRTMGEIIKDPLLPDQCTQVIRPDEVPMAMNAVSMEITPLVQTLGMGMGMDTEATRPLVMIMTMATSEDTKVRLMIIDTAFKGQAKGWGTNALLRNTVVVMPMAMVVDGLIMVLWALVLFMVTTKDWAGDTILSSPARYVLDQNER